MSSWVTAEGVSTVAWKVTSNRPPAAKVWLDTNRGGADAGWVDTVERMLANSTLSRKPYSPLSQFSVPGVA